MTMQSDVLIEPAEADDMWWDDAEAEDNRLRKFGEKASRTFLALLERHHTYGTGEMVLPSRGGMP